MRVLQVYNKYRTWGGEDTVVELEADLLRRNGHEVECLSARTSELEGASAWKLLTAGLGTVWSFRGYAQAQKAIAAFSPHILHVHNTFPLLSPSVFWAAGRAGIPVVHTLHNYRLTCSSASLFRDDKPCLECVGHFPWPALRYRCFGSSISRTAAVAAKNVVHRWLGTFQTKIHAYIALTKFSKEIFVRAGLPRERIFVKSNFYSGPEHLVALRLPRVIFAGAIARKKGVHLLLEAWTNLSPKGYQLMMVGDGPERTELERRYAAAPSIVWCGALPREKVVDLIAASQWLALPSIAHETFGLTILEALSSGTPVIVSDQGAFRSIISPGQEGLMFSTGDAAALRETLREALLAAPMTWTQWSRNAKDKFLREYTDITNYEQLMAIYQHAIDFYRGTRSHAQERQISKSVAGAHKFL